jgi:hypothetical protein
MQNAEYVADLHHFARAFDLGLTVLQHDMTPALFPMWYPEGYSAVWNQNCAMILARANRVLVYSDSTRNDVIAFAREHGVTLGPIEKIRLADEIGALGSETSANGADARRRFAAMPFVLSVGGIHLRKNYGLLYEVWQILRAELGDACPHLLIVGGVAWNGGETAKLIREDPRVNGHIHILDDIDDGTLSWLYDHALFTAYPSLYEGWGLPVGESLAHGKLCLSSSVSSMKEIAPELTELIDPYDRIRWAAMIRHYAASASARAWREQQIRADFVVTGWGDTCDDLLAALKRPSLAPRATPYNLGEIAFVGREGNGGDYLGTGWFRRESWGCWAKSISAEIELTLVHPPGEDLLLSVVAKTLKPAREGRQYRIRANETDIGEWHFLPLTAAGDAGQEMLVSRCRVPRAAIGDDRRLRLRIEADRLCSVADLHAGSADQRKLGLGLVAFIVEAQTSAGDPALLLGNRADTRAMLRVQPTVDLTHALTVASLRPSPMPDRWIREFAPYARGGQPRPDLGIVAQGGTIRLALGLARLRLDRGADLEIIVHAPATTPGAIRIGLFVNDRWTDVITLDDPTAHQASVRLDAATLSRSDPLRLLFIGADADSEFAIAAIRLFQDATLPIDSRSALAQNDSLRRSSGPGVDAIPPGLLGGGWYRPEPRRIWSIGDLGELRLHADPAAEAPALLSLQIGRIASGEDDDAVEIVAGDTVLLRAAFDPAAPGLVVSRNIVLVHDPKDPLDITLRPNNLLLQRQRTADGDPRCLGILISDVARPRLLPIDAGATVSIGPSSADRVLLLDGWHLPETYGCWTSEAIASLLVRPDGATHTGRLVLGCEVLASALETPPLIVQIRIDGEAAAACEVTSTLFEVVVPVGSWSTADHHVIDIEGVPPRSPRELGYSDDERRLGIRLKSIALQPEPLAKPAGNAASRRLSGQRATVNTARSRGDVSMSIEQDVRESSEPS